MKEFIPESQQLESGESADWLAAIKDGFLWNVRKLQRSTSLQESAGKL